MLVSAAPMIAVHAAVGAYGHVLRFWRLERRIRAADRKGIFDPARRGDLLRRGFMASITLGGAKSRVHVRWWHIAIAIAVIRLILMLFN